MFKEFFRGSKLIISEKARQESKLMFENRLKEIDFGILRDIFTDIYKKTSLDPKNLNFKELKDINIIANFLPSHHVVAFRGFTKIRDEIFLQSSKNYISREDYTIVDILRSLVHEETHAMADNKYYKKGTYLSGLEIWNNNEILFQNFNEALTEKISDIVIREYLKRVGKTEFVKQLYPTATYKKRRVLFNKLLHEISKETFVPMDVVLKSFIHGYITGIDLRSLDGFSDKVKNIIKEYTTKIPEDDMVEITMKDRDRIRNIRKNQVGEICDKTEV